MKRTFFIFLIIIALFITVSCFAENAADEILSVLNNAGLKDVAQLQTWRNTVVCFAKKNNRKTLCVLEKKDAFWHLIIANPTALRQDMDYPALLLDNDQSICWTYQGHEMRFGFECRKEANGSWGRVSLTMTEPFSSEKINIYKVSWRDDHGGEIVYQIRRESDKKNLTVEEEPRYLPAPWLKDCIDLANFNVERFPAMGPLTDDYFGWPGETFFQDAAACLMPEYSYIHGVLNNNEMHFLMRKPTGEKVYVVCDDTFNPHQVNLIESTPLPEDAVLGVENFTQSLGWGTDYMVSIQNFPNHPWCGLSTSWGFQAEGVIFFGWDCVFTDEYHIYVGSHPWMNISNLDWNSIPVTLVEATSRMDAGSINLCYAVVNNPNPADRLHLREQADKKSRSLGKYYNGTPVRVYDVQGDWARVDIGNESGWMMKKYLTMGEEGKALLCDMSAMPQMRMRGEELKLYAWTDGSPYTTRYQGEVMKIIGMIGDEWYHVWFPKTNEFVFVRQSDLWEGNG